MPNFELNSKQKIEDFVRGCTFLGTGGGGLPGDGLKALMNAYNEGEKLEWIDPDDIDDEDWTICTYGMGSIAPRTPEIKEKMKKIGLTKVKYEEKCVQAIKELEEYKGIKIKAIVSLEIGGNNTPEPVATAARLGIKVVDGDYGAGRAIPEIPQNTPNLKGYPMTPMTSVDEWGNICIIKKTVNNALAEKIGKLISSVAFALVGNTAYLLKGKEMKECLVPGTLTLAYNIGKTIRESRENKKDPIEAVINLIKGYILFEGQVSKKNWEDREGYYWGTTYMDGTGDFKGDTFKIWFKNENHISWYNGRSYVTSPDIITVVRKDTCEPITNPELEVRDKVVVLGKKAHDVFRSEKGLEVLGPRHFEFDFDYVPIEKLIK